MRRALVALVVLALASPAAADEAATVAIEPAEADAIAARLAGHRFELAVDRRSLRIRDVAGAGAPRVGVIERDGAELVLVTAEARWRLAGPLARPRIAGPGYTVWVIGIPSEGKVPRLTVQRLGILRRPALTAPSN